MIIEARWSCSERTRHDTGCYMKVGIIGIVPEIFKRVDTQLLCEELYSIHVGNKLGACRIQ
jgi:hypothetical protein